MQVLVSVYNLSPLLCSFSSYVNVCVLFSFQQLIEPCLHNQWSCATVQMVLTAYKETALQMDFFVRSVLVQHLLLA